MIFIVTGEPGNATVTGITKDGIETTPGVIGQGRNFTGHHQVIQDLKGLIGNQAYRDIGGPMTGREVWDRMVNRVDRDIGYLMVNRVDPAAADRTLRYIGQRAG